MTTHAYSQLYLDRISRAVGNMLHAAIYEFKIDGTEFLKLFIQSGVAEQIESGNPKYIAGKSGLELFFDVMERVGREDLSTTIIENYDRSDAYWCGWMITHYQWKSGRTFKFILDVIPYHDLLSLYGTLHEADIQKCYEVLDAYFSSCESRLKTIRRECGLTQEQLAQSSGVSINTIRAYERKSKSLNKAQFDIIVRLSNAMKCNITDLIE